jgi:hypothetical protein
MRRRRSMPLLWGPSTRWPLIAGAPSRSGWPRCGSPSSGTRRGCQLTPTTATSTPYFARRFILSSKAHKPAASDPPRRLRREGS